MIGFYWFSPHLLQVWIFSMVTFSRLYSFFLWKWYCLSFPLEPLLSRLQGIISSHTLSKLQDRIDVDRIFFFPPRHVACGILVPRPGIEPGPSAVKAQNPNHWTTREFPQIICFLFFWPRCMACRFTEYFLFLWVFCFWSLAGILLALKITLYWFYTLIYLNVSSLNWASIFVSRFRDSTVSGIAHTLLSSYLWIVL